MKMSEILCTYICLFDIELSESRKKNSRKRFFSVYQIIHVNNI